MTPLQTASLGLLFWVISLFQIIIMAWMWKYNDPGKYTSEPHADATDPWQTFLKKWIITHRALGVIYLLIYILLMSQMLPRMWTYQVELPARTVIHLVLGLSLGIILISKIALIRFFKHLAHHLPLLGYLLFFFTSLLLAVSVPFAYQEQQMINSTRAFSAENILRVEHLLPKAGYSEESARELADLEVLKAGRHVLLQKCVQCHDLRTILAKPRTPKGWLDLVERMANKPIISRPILDQEIDWATTYLVGITPDLQNSLKRKRRSERVVEPLQAGTGPDHKVLPEVNMAEAKLLWEETCSQCHELSEIDDYGGDTEEGWRETVVRMVEENELYEEAEILEQIIQYLAWSRPL